MRKTTTFFMLALAAAWCLGGCSSDTTAPNDPVPSLTNRQVAGQSGFFAVALVQVAPVSLNYTGSKIAAEGEYEFMFAEGDPVQGTVNLQFRLGGADGDLVEFGAADWARAYTAAGSPLAVTVVEGTEPWLLPFNLVSEIDRTPNPDTATVSGEGTLVMGSYSAAWTLEGFVVAAGESSMPAAGTLTFTTQGKTATVTFDGDHLATVTIGDATYTLNLNNGELTEVP